MEIPLFELSTEFQGPAGLQKYCQFLLDRGPFAHADHLPFNYSCNVPRTTGNALQIFCQTKNHSGYYIIHCKE